VLLHHQHKSGSNEGDSPGRDQRDGGLYLATRSLCGIIETIGRELGEVNRHSMTCDVYFSGCKSLTNSCVHSLGLNNLATLPER